MDLETENRIAAILLKEAGELRRHAEKEGVHVYLRQPQVRCRPNSRFLTATVLGVQQANRDVEVNEMWRVRQKELELNDKLIRKSKYGGDRSKIRGTESRNRDWKHDNRASSSFSLSKGAAEVCCSQEVDGLRDEEVEEFLHSRAKRGRGTIGSRMDETGPYLPISSESPANPWSSQTMREERIVLGPEKPPSLKSLEYSSGEEASGRKSKKGKKASSKSSEKHSRKHKSKKDKSRDEKKKPEEGRKK